MKVSVPSTMYDEPVRREPSFAGRLVRFMIWIHLVPVRLSKDGRASFSLCSWRCFFSFVLWSLLPICGIVNFVYQVMILPMIISGHMNITVGDISGFITGFSFFQTAALLPPCFGYLFSHSELAVPVDIAPTKVLKMLIFWLMKTLNLFSPEILGLIADGNVSVNVVVLCYKISIIMIFGILDIGLALLKIHVSSYQQECKQMQTYRHSDLVPASTRTLNRYKTIKKGSGPLFIVSYTSSTMFITTVLFQIVKRIVSPFEVLLGIIIQILTLYEISGYGQLLHNHLCSAASFVR